MALVKRSTKGEPLTAAEYDGNLDHTLSMGNMLETTAAKVLTSTERTKLSNIEENATADMSGAEIKSAYEGEADTNAFTDTEKTKLSNLNSADYATAAQGVLAGTALQPEDISSGTITPRDGDIDLSGGSDGHVLTVQADGSLAPEAIPEPEAQEVDLTRVDDVEHSVDYAQILSFSDRFNAAIALNDLTPYPAADLAPYAHTFPWNSGTGPWTGGDATDHAPGNRVLEANGDCMTKCDLSFEGDNSKNGGEGTAPNDVEHMLTSVLGFTNPKLHEVSNGTLKLRSYPVSQDIADGTTTWNDYFQWHTDNTPFSEKYAVSGMISTFRHPAWRRTLRYMLPLRIRMRINMSGRGQHFSLWLYHAISGPFEIDILEAVVDGGNLSAGHFFSYNSHTEGSDPAQVFETGTNRIGEWQLFELDLDGTDLVIYRNGVAKYTFPAAPFIDEQMFLMATWEGGGAGSWAGQFQGDMVPRAQPADPTTATPWPCEAEFDYIQAGTAMDERFVSPIGSQLISSQANNDLTVNPKFWTGSQAEYDGLTPTAGELYFVLEA